MKENNVIQKKSFDFAVRSVNAFKYLIKKNHEYVITRQFMRSSTSIGANVEEAIGAQTTADFHAKISIAYKEARESSYWIRVLEATGYLTKIEAASLLSDAEELKKILAKIKLNLQNLN